MSDKHEMHVISNTHWDREWLCNFQETRLMLMEFFDSLLNILDKRPEYRAFLLDSQTVPIEDYLEVRPENRERIIALVKTGRLFIGPWYTAPECFCIGGESLVRNLLYGHKVGREFGGVMKVGHTPFSYGQNSQMPQIYQGFGIDTMLFYHGVSHDDVANEFIFEGADGSRVLGSQMSSFARYNYYYHVYRYVKFGEAPDDRMYDWRNGGCPFHLCSEAHAPEHHLLLDPKCGFDRAIVAERVRALHEMEAKVATTPYLAFMMGHDSSVADELELNILEEAQKHFGADRIFHSTLPDYMEKVKKSAKNLTTLKGERRVPKPMPLIMHLYSDVLSSRTRMKRLNALAEMDLQRWTEPFAVCAWQLGAEYPQSLMDMAWKTLLQCHAHDSIAGSGVDDIEQDMMYRLRQVLNISAGIKRRSLEHIQRRINNANAKPDDVLVTVFNASPHPRSEVVTAVLDIPLTSATREFQLREATTKKIVPVQVVSRKPHHAIVNHAWDAPAMMKCERATVHMEAKDVPPLGYATYAVDRAGKFATGSLVRFPSNHLAEQEAMMENEYLQIGIGPTGTLNVHRKLSNHSFFGLNEFEDSGEAGMAWMHVTPAHDRVIWNVGFPASVSLEENGPLLARYRVDYHMKIPAGLDENGGDSWQRRDGVGNAARRTEETRDLLITSFFTLRKGSPAVEVVTRFNNTADCHRLRVKFPTRFNTKECHVESAFDVVEREITFGPKSPWFGSQGVTFPMQRFVDVSDGKFGLAIITDGLREYEVTQDYSGSICITLLRAYELALTTVSKRWDVHPEMKLSQCPGEHEFRYWIYPHKGRWDTGCVYEQVERLCVPLEPAQTGVHKGDLPQRHGFMNLEGDNLAVSAIKRSEDGEGIVVRVFNPTDSARQGRLTFARKIKHAEDVTLEEIGKKKLSTTGKSVRFRLGRKKIGTFKVIPA
ncbi:MAG: hypothetical protein HY706_10880 [Candidatus Hydrogenedentes bacterium]|nr:hypothetical protein [Candidatus Hydrogenedentota bacterium]